MTIHGRQYNKESHPILSRAYELGYKHLADYCCEVSEKNGADEANRLILEHIDKFFSRGIYAFVPPEDKERIKNLADELEKVNE